MNNTRVPARLYYKPSGALVEVLLLEEQQNNKWLALVKPGRFCSQGRGFFFEPHGRREERESLSATVLETDEATGGACVAV